MPRPAHQEGLPVYESPAPKVTVLLPVTIAAALLTGVVPVLQTDPLLQLPLVTE